MPHSKHPLSPRSASKSAGAAKVPTLGRRLLAWSLEIALLAGSTVGPFYLGHVVNQRAVNRSAELAPALQEIQQQGAKILGISPRSLPTQVTPLTNLLWTASLGLPFLLTLGHLYTLGRSGRSAPKRWLGLQVLAVNGQMPGVGRALVRELVGKWGSPLILAYGVWQVSGAFPVVSIFVGLAGLALIGESLTGLGSRSRRAWHDWLAGTCVVDQNTGAMIHLSSLWQGEPKMTAGLGQFSDWVQTAGPRSVIINPDRAGWRATDLTLPKIGVGLGLLITLGGLIGVGGYFLLGRPASFPLSAAEESLYGNLVSTLTNPELDPAARRAAVLALGNLPDERVTPLLVDLIAQTDDSLWLDALQQALIARGPEAFPALRRLNRGLAADLTMPGPALRQTTITRLETVNRIITKLLLLETGDRSTTLDLSRMNLGAIAEADSNFRLELKNQNLSNINWQGSILAQAQFEGARFYSLGPDTHPDTYDDRTADLSGADLSYANLSGADLTLAQLVNSGLVHTNLTRANLTLADLSGANLEDASLIQAVLSQANLAEARLSKANLTEAQLLSTHLTGARLAEVKAAGARLIGANFQGAVAIAAQFHSADFSQAAMANADLSGANLQNANLRNADLSGVSFRDADLRGAGLQGAVIADTDFAGAILTELPGISEGGFVEAVPNLAPGNQYSGVDFSRGRNLSTEQLSFICAQGGIHSACGNIAPGLP
ncbi:MAG: pentapeptide repeat-containing protein [Leptolyngbyaceae cyanobacterium]